MTLLLGASYPFLKVLFSTLVFMAFLLWIWLSITCFVDIFRRRDTSGVSKALWIVLIIVTPYLGVLLYLIINQNGIAERGAKDAQAVAHGLLGSGAITQEEFDRLKAKALAG